MRSLRAQQHDASTLLQRAGVSCSQAVFIRGQHVGLACTPSMRAGVLSSGFRRTTFAW